MENSLPIIKVKNITMTFPIGTNFYDHRRKALSFSKKLIVLNKLDFCVMKGEILTILGTNGAGKTTLLKLLAALLIPQEGIILINGNNINQKRNFPKELIGFMPAGERGFYHRLSLKGNLEFYASLYNLKKKRLKIVLIIYLSI